MTRIRVGGWRDGPMEVVSGPNGRERVHFEAPAPNRLEAEMARFLVWFDLPPETDPVIHAAIAHLWLVTIHPFGDGNGRIARAIAGMAYCDILDLIDLGALEKNEAGGRSTSFSLTVT